MVPHWQWPDLERLLRIHQLRVPWPEQAQRDQAHSARDAGAGCTNGQLLLLGFTSVIREIGVAKRRYPRAQYRAACSRACFGQIGDLQVESPAVHAVRGLPAHQGEQRFRGQAQHHRPGRSGSRLPSVCRAGFVAALAAGYLDLKYCSVLPVRRHHVNVFGRHPAWETGRSTPFVSMAKTHGGRLHR